MAAARETWGRDVEVMAALGHGRSYGDDSRFLLRGLPGILQSGLWRELSRRPASPDARDPDATWATTSPTAHGAEHTLAWVEECLRRLAPLTRDVTLTGLPLASLRLLSPARYLLFRTVFVPSCRLPLARVLADAERVSAGLEAIAARRGLRLVRLRPEWYGFDPIHIRRALWRPAWREILLGEGRAGRRRRRERVAGARPCTSTRCPPSGGGSSAASASSRRPVSPCRVAAASGSTELHCARLDDRSGDWSSFTGSEASRSGLVRLSGDGKEER